MRTVREVGGPAGKSSKNFEILIPAYICKLTKSIEGFSSFTSLQEIFEDVFSVQGGVGKVAGLRRGSHETALAQNQEVEGVSKPGEKSGGSGGLWVN